MEEAAAAAAAAAAEVKDEAEDKVAEIRADEAAAKKEVVKQAEAEGADEAWLLEQFASIEKAAEAREKRLMEWLATKLEEITTKLSKSSPVETPNTNLPSLEGKEVLPETAVENKTKNSLQPDGKSASTESEAVKESVRGKRRKI
jgi:hypothetical protein